MPDHFTSYTPTEGPLPRPGDPDSILLNRYRVIDLADNGGFGNVLVCWDIRLQRRVAIKCLPLSGVEGSSQEEALAEARTSSFLSHPNIVTVFDFETDEEYAYIVMEYVDGVTLSEFMRRVEGGVLIWSEAAYVLSCVASALEFAHENGVLHLDIKPANVMIDYSGNVKLADFGMASLASAAGWAGARGGTVGYMPPEQLSGDMVDERTDVFSLACVTFQSLTGTNPFAATTAEESLAEIEKGAPLLSTFEPELAGPVELAFMAAFSASPHGRMSGANEFAHEVIPSLGDPDEGKRSIVQLLSQADSETFDEGQWRSLDPVGRRVPSLPQILQRVVNAASVGALVFLLCPLLGVDSLRNKAIVAALSALASGALAPAGFVVAILALGFSCVVPGLTPVSILLAAFVTLAGAGLFTAMARTDKSSPAALAIPVLTSNPLTAPFAAALACTPGHAATLSVFSALCSLTMSALFTSAETGISEASLISSNYFSLSTVVALVAIGVSAAVASILARRNSRAFAWAGQGVAAVLMVAGVLAAKHLEISGFWSGVDVKTLLFALLFPVLMIIVIALFGPPQPSRRDE